MTITLASLIIFLCAFQAFFGLLILPRGKHQKNVKIFLFVSIGFSFLNIIQSSEIFRVKPTIIFAFLFILSIMIYLFIRQYLTATSRYVITDLLYLSPILLSLLFMEYYSIDLALSIGGLISVVFLALRLYWEWSKKGNKKHVKQVVLGMVFMVIQLASITLTNSLNLFSDYIQNIFKYGSCVLNLLILNYFLFKSITNKENFTTYYQPKDKIIDKNSINNLEDDFLQTIFDDLHKTVVEKGLYKTHRISLLDVSQQTGFNVREISRAINIYNQTSFNDYINQLRIDSVKQIFLQNDQHNIKILDIGLSSGFSSKTTFNVAFKKFAGCTPSDFVNQVNN
jgi:AraC-like DNA-binding protein